MKLAVSACLLGTRCRYDGKSKPNDQVIALKESHTLIPVCPEVMAGLPIPHPANEIQTQCPCLKVVDSEGIDNTQAFIEGSKKALDLALAEQCEGAILKAKSPSCGVGLIYDGSFQGTLVEGNGVAAEMFIKAGIPTTTEKELNKLDL